MKNNIWILACLFGVWEANAQVRKSTYNDIMWACYFGDHKITDKWGLHTEYQWRRVDFGANAQQSLARIGVNYQPHAKVMFTLGYGLIHTYSYGDLPIARLNSDGEKQLFPEHRIYEDVLLTDKVGKLELSHRFRMEQRYVSLYYDALNNRIEGKWKFFNRSRYRIRLAYPLNEKLYIHAYDEFFIGFGKDLGYNVFDQNRINVGLGYKLNKNAKVELGYFNQTLQKGRLSDNMAVFEYNNGILIALVYNVDFRKKEQAAK